MFPDSKPTDVFVEVSSARDIQAVAALAREIWREHYSPIIGIGQVDYMLDRFQSFAAISEQIADQGYWYFLIRHDHRTVGYLALQRREAALFLSKLYVKKSVRGRGLGRRAVDFTRQFARDQGLAVIRLTVNKHNAAAIAAYERTGFIRSGEVVTDIGGGYVMDDYAFELNC